MGKTETLREVQGGKYKFGLQIWRNAEKWSSLVTLPLPLPVFLGANYFNQQKDGQKDRPVC